MNKSMINQGSPTWLPRKVTYPFFALPLFTLANWWVFSSISWSAHIRHRVWEIHNLSRDSNAAPFFAERASPNKDVSRDRGFYASLHFSDSKSRESIPNPRATQLAPNLDERDISPRYKMANSTVQTFAPGKV